MDNKKLKICFSLVVLIIIGLIIYGLYLLIHRDNDIILDKSKDIVYTYYENKDYNQSIPNVNIKKIGNEINNTIIEFTNAYKDIQSVNISYRYQVDGNILSLFIIVEDSKYEGAPDVSFKAYNINLKKLKVLTDEEVLDLFNLDNEIVVKEINNKFYEYYTDEINKKIISNMTYQEYMSKRGLSNLKDKIYLNIYNTKLYVYVDYNAFLSEEKRYYLATVGYSFEFK